MPAASCSQLGGAAWNTVLRRPLNLFPVQPAEAHQLHHGCGKGEQCIDGSSLPSFVLWHVACLSTSSERWLVISKATRCPDTYKYLSTIFCVSATFSPIVIDIPTVKVTSPEVANKDMGSVSRYRPAESSLILFHCHLHMESSSLWWVSHKVQVQ